MTKSRKANRKARLLEVADKMEMWANAIREHVADKENLLPAWMFIDEVSQEYAELWGNADAET